MIQRFKYCDAQALPNGLCVAFFPVTPGESLPEAFLLAFGTILDRLAESVVAPRRRIGTIVAGKRAITAVTATRRVLSGMTAGFGRCLQRRHDPARTREALADRLAANRPPAAVACPFR